MRQAMKIVVSALFLLSLQPFAADAGKRNAEEAVCSKPTEYMGETIHGCMGTMAGFRNSADPEAYAELNVRANGVMSFSARLNGVWLVCVFEDSYDAQYFAAIANNFQNTRFVIGSRDGKCDMAGAYLLNGSRFGTY